MEKLENIGYEQKQTRQLLGYATLGLAAVLGVLYVGAEWPFWVLIVLFVIVQNGILLLLEAKHGVCPVNAVRGKQSMDGRFSFGKEPFRDKKLLPQVQQIALKDFSNASIYALVIVILVYLLTINFG